MAAGKTDVTSEIAKSQTHPSHLCCYSQRICNLEKLKGFDFCHKHILEDKASPFKPCDFYAVKNDKRCTNPAPKMGDREKSYCIIHTRKAELRRVVEKKRKKRRRGNSSTIEEDNEESITEKRRRTSSSASQKSVDESHKGDDVHSSDDDLSTDLGLGGSLKVDSAWHGDVDSDAESVDSEEEDPLRHAGTWTMDEVSKMCCDKMTRLKSLYIAQYKRLFHVLKEKRRKYLQLIQAEQENDSGDKYVSPSEILGTTTHSKRHGVEAILHKQAKEKCHGLRHQSSSHQRCSHVSDSVRCPNKILPLTKFCIHHISNDPNQLLFQSCSFKTGEDKTCSNVVPKIYNYSTCQLHMSLTTEPSRADVKKDLEEANKRDQEKKVPEKLPRDVSSMSLPLLQEPDKQLLMPKALQQKSSALIPPLPPISIPNADSSISEPTPSVSTITPSKPKQFAVPNLKLEKMDVDSPAAEGLGPTKGSLDSTPMEVMSPASGYSTPAGIQSISPTLLAASLVAVCSATASPTVPSVLATSSPSQPTSSGIITEGNTSTNTSSIFSTAVDKSQDTTIPTSIEVKSVNALATVSADEGKASSFAGGDCAVNSGTISTEANNSAPISKEEDNSASTSVLNSKDSDKSASTSTLISKEGDNSASTLAPDQKEDDKSASTSIPISKEGANSSSTSPPISKEGDKSASTSTPISKEEVKSTTSGSIDVLANTSIKESSAITSTTASTGITPSALTASSTSSTISPSNDDDKETKPKSITDPSSASSSKTDFQLPRNESADPPSLKNKKESTAESIPSASMATITSSGTLCVVPVVDIIKSQPTLFSNALTSAVHKPPSVGSTPSEQPALALDTETKTYQNTDQKDKITKKDG